MGEVLTVSGPGVHFGLLPRARDRVGRREVGPARHALQKAATVGAAIRVRSGSGTIGGVINYWYYLDDQDMYVTINGGTVSITATRILSTSANGPTNAGAYEEAAKYDWTAMVLDVTGY